MQVDSPFACSFVLGLRGNLLVLRKLKTNLSHLMTKPTKWLCAQRRLRSAWASAQSDQSSLCAQWVAKDPSFLHADSEASDQTGRMPRLIWFFAGHTCHFVGFVMRWLILPRSTIIILPFWKSFPLSSNCLLRPEIYGLALSYFDLQIAVWVLLFQ